MVLNLKNRSEQRSTEDERGVVVLQRVAEGGNVTVA